MDDGSISIWDDAWLLGPRPTRFPLDCVDGYHRVLDLFVGMGNGMFLYWRLFLR